MPNGGPHHCWGCCNFDPDENFCELRNVAIQQSHWTTCRNRNKSDGAINGPLFAIVAEVKAGRIAYGDIPYFDGCRASTVSLDDGDTVVRFTDPDGETHEFETITEYLAFFRDSGKET